MADDVVPDRPLLDQLFNDANYAVRVVGRADRDGSCIVADPLAKRTLCGAKCKDIGTTWARFVQAHIDGHNPVWCERCLYLWAAAAAACLRGQDD